MQTHSPSVAHVFSIPLVSGSSGPLAQIPHTHTHTKIKFRCSFANNLLHCLRNMTNFFRVFSISGSKMGRGVGASLETSTKCVVSVALWWWHFYTEDDAPSLASREGVRGMECKVLRLGCHPERHPHWVPAHRRSDFNGSDLIVRYIIGFGKALANDGIRH